jgi:2,2-dialkylglycine decarboxylase (pyruvate)
MQPLLHKELIYVGLAGSLVPPKSYMQALRRAADERDMLLMFDEAQTAFGRIGVLDTLMMSGTIAASRSSTGPTPRAWTAWLRQRVERRPGRTFRMRSYEVEGCER